MKKILHILLISCFSFTIISCAAINSTTIAIGAGAGYWYKDDIRAWYDDFSKEADETEKANAKLEQTTNSTISEKLPSFNFLFVSVGENGTLLTSSNGTNGLKGLLDQRLNSEQSPTVRIPWWWLVFPEPSSPHRMEPNGLKGNLIHQ